MKPEDEREFLVNEFLEGPQDELKEIVRVATRRPMPYDRKAAFLKEFTFGLFEAYRRQRFEELKKVEERKIKIEKAVEVKPKVEFVKKPEVKKEFKIELPPPPKPKFIEESRNIIVGSKGQVFAKAIYKNGVYNLEEPGFDKNWVSILDLLNKNIGKKILKDRGLLENYEFIKKNIIKACNKLKMGYNDELIESARYYFIRDLVNFGRIDALVKDDFVKEIICDGIGKKVVVNYKGKESETNIVFEDDNEMDKVVMNIAEKAGKSVNLAHPFLNINLGNLRVQANIKSGFSGARFIIKKM